MPIDLQRLREENPAAYSGMSLREVGNSVFSYNPQLRSMYGSADEWADSDGLREMWDADDAKIAKDRERAKQQAAIQQRGLLGQVGSTVARGLVGGAEMGLRAGRAVLGDEPEEDTRLGRGIEAIEQFREDTPFLQAKRTEGLGQTVREAGESVVTSLTPALTGAAAGAAIGSAIPGLGTLAGAAIGFVGGAPLFGLATYDDYVERGIESKAYQEGRITREEIEENAVLSGVAEGGLEFVSNFLDVLTGMGARFLTTPAKAALKQTIKQTISGGIKGTGKRIAMVTAAELPTELATAAIQTQPENLISDQEMTILEGVKEAFGPALVASLMFGGLADAGYRAKTRANIKALKDPKKFDKATRHKAVENVAKEFERVAPQYAETWRANAQYAVEKGLPISEEISESDQLLPTEAELDTAAEIANAIDPDINEAILQQAIEQSIEGRPIAIARRAGEKILAKGKEQAAERKLAEEKKTKTAEPKELEKDPNKQVVAFAEKMGITPTEARKELGLPAADKEAKTTKAHIKEEPADKKVPEGRKIERMKGKYVDYQGVKGFLRKEKDGYHVVGPGVDVIVEGGESGQSVEDIGLKRVKKTTAPKGKAVPQKVRITKKVGNYSPRTGTLYRPDGKEWTLLDFNRDKKNRLVSATFIDHEGNEKTIRSKSAIEQFERTQAVYEEMGQPKQPLGRKEALTELRRGREDRLSEDADTGRRGIAETRRITEEKQQIARRPEEEVEFDMMSSMEDDSWVDAASPEELEGIYDWAGVPKDERTPDRLRSYAGRWMELFEAFETEPVKPEPKVIPEKLPPSVDITIQSPDGAVNVKAKDAAIETHRDIRSYERIMTCLNMM